MIDPQVSGPERRTVPPTEATSGPGASGYDRLCEAGARALCRSWQLEFEGPAAEAGRVEARIVVDSIDELLEDRGQAAIDRHVIEFDVDEWEIEHSLACRLDECRGCVVLDALPVGDFDWLPAGGPGRYWVDVDNQGMPIFVLVEGRDGEAVG